MSQQKKNIRLLITWLLLVAVTSFVYFSQGPSERVNVPRDLFSLTDPSVIDRIRLSSATAENTLKYSNTVWKVNDLYKADPQRVTVLFAILKQNRTRRKVAKNRQGTVDSLMASNGIDVVFYRGAEEVKKFRVASSEDGNLSYFQQRPGENYVVEIPGYRVNLAGIFELDENGWRDPLVFDINWANLQEVNLSYPGRAAGQFDVIYDGRSLQIRQLAEADTAKLTELLDKISLLHAREYLDAEEIEEYPGYPAPTQAIVTVRDITGNFYTVEFFEQGTDQQEILGRIDSTGYAVFEFNQVRRILRPKRYFEVKEE